jgi:deoxyribodipyrimidine photo-lyase
MRHGKPTLQVVWFKRDLRIADHAPLARASERGPVLPLYVAEPSVLHAPDFDPSHWTFIRASLIELRRALATSGQPLVVRTGEVLAVLNALHDDVGIAGLWSHEETGNWISYQRDRAVRSWAKERGVRFTELTHDGVVRLLSSRDDWADIWEARMREPLTPAPRRLRPVTGVDPGPIPDHADLGLGPDRRTGAQRGGEALAHLTLDDFLQRRGANYQQEMSSPLTAADSCSRISPYLTWGNLSMRQVVRAMRQRTKEVRALPPAERGAWPRAMASFESRLHWRDHFIQKLEDEPRIEFDNFVRAYDGLREETFDAELFEAWATGRTGYPLVDASMRYLLEHGWINFRMRAMLVSFATYDLWLHWREPGLHLARLFLDYEPGIHWSQHQMQAGTTGINTIRVYNPTKQAQDQDPDGIFIRRWVPELEHVPHSFVHSPWLMPESMQAQAGCVIGRDYPAPVVDHAIAAKAAQQRLYAVRRQPEAREEADAVRERHGSRKRPSIGRYRRSQRSAEESTQLSLGLE